MFAIGATALLWGLTALGVSVEAIVLILPTAFGWTHSIDPGLARTLEAVTRHFLGEKAERLMLARGFDELHESGKIDERLYEWGNELRGHRNLAAHPSDRTFSKEDAEDLYEFVNAICNYLFVLQDHPRRRLARSESGCGAASP